MALTASGDRTLANDSRHPQTSIERMFVELGGIEPPSARWSPTSIRPFLHCGLEGYRTGRSAGSARKPPPGLSPMSAVFLAVSGLSLRSTHASVAGLRGSGPVRHCWSRFCSSTY